jgi:hypothetical protein
VLCGEAPTRAEISLMADIATEGRSLVVVANKTDEVTPAQRHEVGGLIYLFSFEHALFSNNSL